MALGLGCRDADKGSLEELLALLQAGSWTIGNEPKEGHGYVVVPSDSSLDAYNRVFRLFDPGDSTRQELYRTLPTDLLLHFPIASISSRHYQRLHRDTLLATIVFTRPPEEALAAALRPLIISKDSSPPSQGAKAAFTAAFRRVRSELVEPDTAFVALAAGHIVKLTTALFTRDSLRTDSLRRVAFARFASLAATARLAIQSFNDYSGDDLGYPTGGSVKGNVTPTTVGWIPPTEGLLALLAVECQGVSGDRITRELGYLITDKVDSTQAVDFLCLWTGDEALNWRRLQPRQVRARLRMDFGRDSSVGAWVTVR